MATASYWLMKAEPDSRIVKGKDVKFSVDDFEAVKTTPWEGVRNHEAKNLMKSMKVGNKVLFYHSNCKSPGIAGFAEVSKEAYPDYTAWDSTHPYFDPKTKQDDPKWFMVELTFATRARHFVPLSLLRKIAAATEPPAEVEYIGEEGAKAVKDMALVNRGRLSVQKVEEDAWGVVQMLAEKGGWDDEMPKAKTRAKPTVEGKAETGKRSTKKGLVRQKSKEDEDEEAEVLLQLQSEADKGDTKQVEAPVAARGRKRKADDNLVEEEGPPLRRSARARK